MTLFFKSALLLLVCLLAGQIQAQRIIINGNGDKIVMYPDGSWRMVEPGDSVLLRQNLQKSESLTSPEESIYTTYHRSEGEIQEYILKQWNELHFHIKAQEKKVQGQFRAATNAKFKSEEKLNTALENKALADPVQLASLHDEYDHAIRTLKQAKSDQNAIRKILDLSKKIGSLPPNSINQKLSGLRSKYNNYLATYEPGASAPRPSSTPNTPDAPVASNKKQEKGKTPVARQVAYSTDIRSTSLPYKSQPYECEIRSDTVDEATGRRKIILNKGLLFTHTDPDLRPYFKDKELITCYGELSKIDAYVYLTIEFQIASSHSQSNFGVLQNGSLLRLKLLDGEYVSLYNIKPDRGRIDAYSGHTVFTGQYALGKDEIRMLQSSGLDKVRILWSTGYEDYDVYKIDFFRERLSCLMAR